MYRAIAFPVLIRSDTLLEVMMILNSVDSLSNRIK